ncbi:hypothetical protein CPB84DRAFT_1780619 [Gymnopilus junonius]|uniref:Uncharacterized protein n=1 Tax=Gymnopilus junonius TaxID=109634 RepID=A0A9P5TME5_GYMJU|nr:hypothetical protein CPB84DRAFT_1780619 [Gymnopilus junonius]
MHDLDREKLMHSPDLYAIWNAKPFFLDAAVKALEAEGDVYEYAFWNDAGSFRREHTYTLWPDPLTVDRIWKTATLDNGKKEDEFLFFPIAALPPGNVRNWKEDMGPVDYDISEGSFFGGSPKIISWWSQTYYAYHNYFLSRSLFVGKDQTLINALFLLFPSRILTVFHPDPRAPQFPNHIPFFDEGYLGACGSEWFYYQYWLSGYEERKKMAEVWMKESKWAGWEWWRKRQECQLANGENWENLVGRAFGKEWSPPERKLVVDASPH